jgi:hypothetical protein
MARAQARFGPARGAGAVAGEVRTAVGRPDRHWRWLMRVVIAVLVVALLIVDAVIRGPAFGNLAILVLILIGIALDAGTLRRRTAFVRPGTAVPPPPIGASEATPAPPAGTTGAGPTA